MLFRKSMGRTAAVAVAVVLTAAGAAGPVAASDTSDDQAQQSAKAQPDRESSQDETPERGDADAEGRDAGGDRGRGDERGDGHTPVTVCHLLGNGSYIELTFDDNALDAHKAHGDLYPVPADGCPASEDEDTAPGAGNDGETGHTPVTVCHVLGNGGFIELTFDDDALDAHQAHGDLYPVPADGCPSDDESTTPGGGEQDDEQDGEGDGETVLPGDDTTTEAEVLGVQERAGTGAVADAEVAGVQQAAAANRAATGPLAGILPQTGAAPMALAGAAGLMLLVLGGTVLARRRRQLG